MAPPDLADLLQQRFFPEMRHTESAIIHDFLEARGVLYDRLEFSVRLGEGETPDPTHLEGIQRMTRERTRRRADLIAHRGTETDIIEAKERLTPGVLGQLRAYQLLWMEAHPEASAPHLVAIGRHVDGDTARVLATEGIEVVLYERPAASA